MIYISTTRANAGPKKRSSTPWPVPTPAFNLSGVTTLNMFPYGAFGGFDSATTASTSVATSAAGAGIEIMSTQYTHVDLNTLGGRLTEWGGNGVAFGHIPQLGSVGSTNGSGGATSLGTAGLGTSEHAGTPIVHANARR